MLLKNFLYVCTLPSQVSPMTDFHLVDIDSAYTAAVTVEDSHLFPLFICSAFTTDTATKEKSLFFLLRTGFTLSFLPVIKYNP
jgi:hypothetical protein